MKTTLTFSAHTALLLIEAPTQSECGAPVSLGWRVRWVCNKLKSTRAELAATQELVEEQAASITQLRSQQERFERVIAVERGGSEWAPRGWAPDLDFSTWGKPGVNLRQIGRRAQTRGSQAPAVWVAYWDDGRVGPQRDTALELMEAVDEEGGECARVEAGP
jgi:hypothetical protein